MGSAASTQILSWPVWHQDVFGRLYEVRVFDDAKPGHVALVALKAVSRRFAGHECDCTWRDGKVQRFPFKTMAAVKRELKRLGF